MANGTTLNLILVATQTPEVDRSLSIGLVVTLGIESINHSKSSERLAVSRDLTGVSRSRSLSPLSLLSHIPQRLSRKIIHYYSSFVWDTQRVGYISASNLAFASFRYPTNSLSPISKANLISSFNQGNHLFRGNFSHQVYPLMFTLSTYSLCTIVKVVGQETHHFFHFFLGFFLYFHLHYHNRMVFPSCQYCLYNI